MNTQGKRKEPRRFIILIPHRDAERLFDEYRAKLFAAGFAGAYSFPAAALLAEAARPFSRGELKELARNIRNLTRESGGKFLSGALGTREFSGRSLFSGPLLNIPVKEELFPEGARDKILYTVSPPLLCAALLLPSDKNPARAESPVLSFRAAALANLSIRPLNQGEADYSYEWKTGVPVWLPKPKEAT